jgi:hypothetical protein
VTDETTRRETPPTDYLRSPADGPSSTDDDDILVFPLRRERDTRSLTQREREERWPIG